MPVSDSYVTTGKAQKIEKALLCLVSRERFQSSLICRFIFDFGVGLVCISFSEYTYLLAVLRASVCVTRKNKNKEGEAR